SLAVRVLDQDDFAGADAPRLAVAGGDLDARVEVDDVLPARRGMPVEIVVGLHFTEDDPGGREPLREPAGAGRLRVLDLDVPEVRFAVLVHVQVVDLHVGSSSVTDYGRASAGGAPAPRRPAARTRVEPIIVMRRAGGKRAESVYTPENGHETGGRSHRGGRAPTRDARGGSAARARGVHRPLLSKPGRRPGALRSAGSLDARDHVRHQH